MVKVNLSVTVWLTHSTTGWVEILTVPLFALNNFSGQFWRLLSMFINLRQYRLEIAGQKQVVNMYILRCPI